MKLNALSFIWSRGIFRPDLVVGNSASIQFSGLSTVGDFVNSALVGDHAGIGLVALGGSLSDVRFGTSLADVNSGSPSLGTGTEPADFSADDTGDPDSPGELWARATVNGTEVYVSAAIRAALPIIDTVPAITNNSATGTDFGDTIDMTTAVWTGAASQSQRLLFDGVAVSAPLTIGAAQDNQAVTGDATAVSSGGSVTVAATGAFTVDDFVAPAFPTGAGSISGILQDGQTLTYTPADDTTGNPDPGSSVEWLNVSDDSVAATGLTIVAAEGANLYVRETLANGISPDATADTAATGVIAAASAPQTAVSKQYNLETGNETIALADEGPAESGSATYAAVGSLPAGVTLSASGVVTTDTDVYGGGSFTVRRTDNNGARDYLVTITLIALGFVNNAGAVEVTLGADTRDALQIDINIDGRTGSLTAGALRAVPSAQGLAVVEPDAFIVTDADSDGLADAGDVVGRLNAGLWAYLAGNTAPTIAWQVMDNGTPVGVADTNFTVPDPSTGPFEVRETDGTSFNTSTDTIAYGGAASFAWSSIFPSGRDGFAMIPGDSQTELLQERTGAAATTVAANGDPVGTVRSTPANGTARNMTANTDGRRPLLIDEGGGVIALDADLNSRVIESIDVALPTEMAVFVAGRCDGAGVGTRQVLWSSLDGTSLAIEEDGGSYYLALFNESFSYTRATTPLTVGQPFTVCLDGAGATLDDGTFYLNGVAAGTYTAMQGIGIRILDRFNQYNGALSVIVARDAAFTSGEIAAMHTAGLAKVPAS